VTFDFTTQPSRPRPKQLKTDGDPTTAFGFTKNRPHTLVLIRGWIRTATPRRTSAGATMAARRARSPPPARSSRGSSSSRPASLRRSPDPAQRAVQLGAAIQFILATHAGAATSGFTGPLNQITLPAATPMAQIELVGRADIPPGTTVLYEILDDAAVWRAYQDGQAVNQLVGFAGPTYTTLKQRFTLTPNAVGDRTPILRGLGARAVVTQDLSDVCEVQRLEYLCDPQTCTVRSPTWCSGRSTMASATSAMRSRPSVQNPLGSLSVRLSYGSPRSEGPVVPSRRFPRLRGLRPVRVARPVSAAVAPGPREERPAAAGG